MYYCKECGKPAVVTDKGVIRSCNCNGVVVTSMASSLQGNGGIKG